VQAEWEPDELIAAWMLVKADWDLIANKAGVTRLGFERRLGHANDRYLRLYTNPPDEIAAGFVEHL